MRIQFNWEKEREIGSDLYKLALRVVRLGHCGSILAESAGKELAKALGYTGHIAYPELNGVFGNFNLYKEGLE